jgi:hypothetical protein
MYRDRVAIINKDSVSKPGQVADKMRKRKCLDVFTTVSFTFLYQFFP